MRTYKPKTLFTGYKIGLKNANTYIGIPSKYFTSGKVTVETSGEKREFHLHNNVATKIFNDRFTPGHTYRLYYFLWQEIAMDEVDN